ncbi:hypothetical protein C6P42_002637 [Pichia californica]|nr:hypothetical protein C6P42_002637 [[Candida] californica]
MLLRPFYPLEDSLSGKIETIQLAALLLEIPNSSIRKRILKYLDIRQLITILKAITKDEKRDDFYSFNDLSESRKSLWVDLVDVFNNLPCVKLVENDNNHNNTNNTNNNNNSNSNSNNNNNNNNYINEDTSWFELSIDSDEYDYLLEYLIDCQVNKIHFPLVEIGTKKYNKIHELLEKHCNKIKIPNDKISVIKDSEILKEKLQILTLVNYEYFDIVEKLLNYDTLNIIGNEVDLFSVSTLIQKSNNLKCIYFKGRLRDYIPREIDEKIKVYYDLIVFDTTDKSQLKDLGSLDRINSLYLSFTLESNINFNWLLNNCHQMRKLYISLNFDTNSNQILETLNDFPKLEDLTLKHCKIVINDDNLNSPILPNLKTLTLIQSDFDSNFLNAVCESSLIQIAFFNCNIKYKSFVKISNYMKNITIINQDVDQCKDLVFLTYKKRSSFKIAANNKCLLNVNEKLLTIKIPESHDLYLTKLHDDYDDNDDSINLNNLDIPFNSTLYFSIYPIFNHINFQFLKYIVKKFDVFKTIIELYSFTNEFYNILNIKNIENVKIYHYDILKLQLYLKKLLVKKELNDEENQFFLPYNCMCENNSTILFQKTPISGQYLKNSNLMNITETKKPHSNMKLARVNKLNHAVINQNGSSNTNRNMKGVKRIHSCKECGKHFSRSTALNRHILVHANYRPFKCDGCGYSFKRSDHLKVHKRVCTGK